MKITGIAAPGARLVRLDLDPRTAMDVFFHLAASLHAEETTIASRTHIAALLPSLKRAIVATGVCCHATLDGLQKHLASKPAPAPLDVAVGKLRGDV